MVTSTDGVHVFDCDISLVAVTLGVPIGVRGGTVNVTVIVSDNVAPEMYVSVAVDVFVGENRTVKDV